MRLFAALIPPEDVLAALDRALAPARREVPELRWTPQDHWHITCAFYPDVPPALLPGLTTRLERAARRSASLTLRIDGLGGFDRPARARVLFATVHSDDDVALRRLAERAAASARREGLNVASGQFRAHLTLARARQPLDLRDVIDLCHLAAGPWLASEVTLVRSHLGQGPQGRPRYEPIVAFPLGADCGSGGRRA